MGAGKCTGKSLWGWGSATVGVVKESLLQAASQQRVQSACVALLRTPASRPSNPKRSYPILSDGKRFVVHADEKLSAFVERSTFPS